MVGEIGHILDGVFEKRMSFELRKSGNAIVSQRGETVLVVISANFFIFPVLGRLSVIEG